MVSIHVIDILGRKSLLHKSSQQPGVHHFTWNPDFPEVIYPMEMVAGSKRQVLRVSLMD